MITQKRLKEVLNYNPDTGVWVWKVSPNPNGIVKAGDQAGNICSTHGYRMIGIDGEHYRSARLAFLYMDGYTPEHYVDHINRNRADDRWCNLRHVSQQCNIRNGGVRSTNKTGVVGVNWDKKKKRWHAQITVNYKNLWLGRFKNFKDAVWARWNAEKENGFPHCLTTSTAYQYLKNNGEI